MKIVKGEQTMMRLLHTCYDFECRLFQEVNRHFDNKILNLFFRTITHIGGATFTIASVLLLMILSSNQTRITAIASALALALSHLPVHLAKKLYPRKRPYMILEKAKVPSNPLQDHSFPSGHTTAIFSVIIPFVIYAPSLSFILIPLGICVGISRIYLGLHYPSDVIAGIILGSFVGTVCFYLLGI
jgi:undecaprenyl-diphosphatase